MTQTDFYAKHGGGILNVRYDNAEFGDHLILHPEGVDQAKELEAKGYTIVAVYEAEKEGKDNYVEIEKPFDNSTHPYKIGYFAVSDMIK